jgi:Fe-S-cluster-containing dehydrogenase component
MPKSNQNDNTDLKKSRRDFMKLGLAATAITCGAGIAACKKTKDKVTLLSVDGRLVEVDEDQVNPVSEKEELTTINGKKGIPGRKFVMVIDLARCNNARKCVSACQKMHHLPEDVEFMSIKLLKDSETGSPYWFPKGCFHCDNPPCVKVCPVNATYKRSDGTVLIDADRCIGCKFCMTACPYSTRIFNWNAPEQDEATASLKYSPERSLPRQIGTVQKCDFCPDMARMNKLPHCVTACPNGVIYFGDENEDVVSNGEEIVKFSELIQERAGYRYQEELGTEPRVWYLPPRDRIFPVERGIENLDEEIAKRYNNILIEG